MTKAKVEQKYKNIPVSPETYERVQLVSEANGFGKRGLGAQVAHWVGQELPECKHEKTPVEIEYFPGADVLSISLKRSGYFCATCKRVYARVSEADLVVEDGKKLLKALNMRPTKKEKPVRCDAGGRG